MGLMIATDASGKTRGTWHGIFMLKGKWRKTNLNVPIEGKPPTDKSGRITLNERGDAAFERSRKAAQKAFDAWRKTARSDPAELVKKAYKARTGVSLEGVPLAKLAERWIGRKRERNLSAKWQHMIETWFSKFARFAEAYARTRGGRKCETINDITPAIAAAWFEDIKKCHAWETVLKMMHLMSGAYKRFSTTGMANPFGDIVMSKSGDPSQRGEFGNERVPRKPLLPGKGLIQIGMQISLQHGFRLCGQIKTAAGDFPDCVFVQIMPYLSVVSVLILHSPSCVFFQYFVDQGSQHIRR